MSNVIYKVYCGSNGKWYTYKSFSQAENLYSKLVMQNYHTQLIEIQDKQSKILKEHI